MNRMETGIAKYYFKPNSLLENIPIPVKGYLRANSATVIAPKNSIIYNEGAFPRGLYIITKGVAKLYTINNAGKEQVIYFMAKNEMFGFRPIICNDESPVFISAIEDCEIEIINKSAFINSLNKSRELSTLFLNYFGNEFRVLSNKISFYAQKPVDERVALTLLILHQKFKLDSEKDNFINFTRKDLANYAGTIIETLSRQLKILLEMKAIGTKKRKIFIINIELLYKRANI